MGGPRRPTTVLLDEFLRRQDGVISWAQALEAGLAPHQVTHRAATGRWLRLGPAVYRVADREHTDRARLFEAALGAGPGATVHGPAAAWWHGLLDDAPATIGVTVPRRRRAGASSAVVRRRDLSHLDRVELRGLWVTDVALTVLETAVALGSGGPSFLDRALQRRVRFPALHRAHCRNVGRRGSPAAAALLAVASDRAGSHAERVLVRLLRVAEIRGWTLHHRTLGYELDLAFVRERVAVEVDGWAWHVDRGRFQADRVRQNALVHDGWRVLRYTWHDLTVRPDEVVDEVRRAVLGG